MALLDSAWAKLERGEEHLDALEGILRTFIDSKPVSFRVAKSDVDGTCEDFYVHLKRSFEPRANAVLGDCIHNLRSVLDHVAMALAIKSGASPNNRETAWPICRSRAEFDRKDKCTGQFARSSGRGRIAKIALPGAQAFVESLQPYNRPADGWLLSELEYLDNRDKHRALNLQYFQPLAHFQPEQLPPGVTIEVINSRLIEGAHFQRITYPPSYDGVKMEPMFTASVCLKRSDCPGTLEVQSYFRDNLIPLIRNEVLAVAARFF